MKAIIILLGIGLGISFATKYWYIMALVFVFILILIIRSAKQRKEYLALPVIFVGNKSTKTYHMPTCKNAMTISQKNLIAFRKIDEPASHGYTPCGICNPQVVRKKH